MAKGKEIVITVKGILKGDAIHDLSVGSALNWLMTTAILNSAVKVTLDQHADELTKAAAAQAQQLRVPTGEELMRFGKRGPLKPA